MTGFTAFPSSNAAMTTPPQAPAAIERDPRRAVLWRAGLKIAGRPEMRCVVVDFSSSGAKVQINRQLPVGAMVKLRSQRFTREAQIVWTRGDEVGLAFSEADQSLMKALDAPSDELDGIRAD
jgi:hypothetical protein